MMEVLYGCMDAQVCLFILHPHTIRVLDRASSRTKTQLMQRGNVRGKGVTQMQDGGVENNWRERDSNGKIQDCDKKGCG